MHLDACCTVPELFHDLYSWDYLSNPRNACFPNYFNAAGHYSVEYWKQVIDSLFTRGYFANSKYLKIDGQPVVIVFDPVS